MLWEFPVLPLLLLFFCPLESCSHLYSISQNWELNAEQAQHGREKSHGTVLPQQPRERRCPTRHGNRGSAPTPQTPRALAHSSSARELDSKLRPLFRQKSFPCFTSDLLHLFFCETVYRIQQSDFTPSVPIYFSWPILHESLKKKTPVNGVLFRSARDFYV